MSDTLPATPEALEKLSAKLAWIVFAIAFILRLWGLGWGLPDSGRHWSYHPDEPVLYAYAQQVEPAKFDFEPGFYNYGTLYLTVLRVAGDMAKTYSGAGDREWAQMRATHLAGRWISALAGAGTATVAFLMLRRRTNLVGALFGAGLVGLTPGFMVHSRFQTVDVLATFFLILSAHNALKLLPDANGNQLDPRIVARSVLLSGLFAGLSAGTKYTGIFALLTLITVVFLSRRNEALRLNAISIGIAILSFVLVTPGALLNSSKFIQDFKYEIQHTSTGHGLVFAGLPNGFVWHVYDLVVGVGPILLALGLLGLAWAAWKREPAAIALGAFFLFYFVLIGRAEVLFLRYTFPLLIGLGFGFGWLIGQWWGRPGWARAVPALGMCGLGGILGGGLAASGNASIWMRTLDAREQVLEGSFHDSVGQVTVGLVSDPWFYTPPIYSETGAPRWVPFSRQMEWMEAAKVVRYVPENPDERFDWDVRLLTEKKPEYVVFSSFETEGLDRLRRVGVRNDLEKLLVGRYVEFAERLKLDYNLERTYGGTGWGVHDLDYIRPALWVWKRKTPGDRLEP